MCFMDNKLESDRGSHCSKSARQRQYPKRLKRVQASTRAKMLRGPSKKRPPELRLPVALSCFLRCYPRGSLTSPPDRTRLYKDADRTVERFTINTKSMTWSKIQIVPHPTKCDRS